MVIRIKMARSTRTIALFDASNNLCGEWKLTKSGEIDKRTITDSPFFNSFRSDLETALSVWDHAGRPQSYEWTKGS